LSACRAPAERLWRGQIDEALVKKLARTARSVLAPMASIFGGVVGQEVAKAVSGKHHPVFQFVYLDAAELLPDYQVWLSSHHGGARAQR
jgi:ubiquitin-activating enzyme E1